MSDILSKSRYMLVLAVGFVFGSILVSPVTAHVGERVGHLWSDHIKPRLSAEGTINTPRNPVNWDQLKNVPAGFADGVDATQDDGSSGERTHMIPQVFERSGSAEADSSTTDMGVTVVYRRGVVSGCGGGTYCPGATVRLYLYDASGAPLTGAGSTGAGGTEVCNPCSYDLSMANRQVKITFDQLIKDAGGFDSNLKLGFGVIVVSGGDPEGVNLQGFVVNSHTDPLDRTYSFFPLEEVPNDALP